MTGRDLDTNLQTYERQDVASYYAALDYLTPCERLLFETYIPRGSAILDLGVGGGRTTPYLSARASRYVAVDYAASMVQACQAKFPGLEFLVADAADLSRFANSSFDVVVFSFNGIDTLSDDGRHRCLQHICRILKPGGFLIFSTHNPRLFIVRPSWNRERLRTLAQRYSAGSKVLSRFLYVVLRSFAVGVACGRASVASLQRILRRFPTRTFWRGEGRLFDSAHGGMSTHYAAPKRVLEEMSAFNLRVVRILGDDYPLASHVCLTGWYYYVFAKPEK